MYGEAAVVSRIASLTRQEGLPHRTVRAAEGSTLSLQSEFIKEFVVASYLTKRGVTVNRTN